MGRDGSDIGVQMRKFVIISTRVCYRSVFNHPFVVGILLVLLYMYRSFPFLFSLFVSASPVLVCTAVLLGILLSFGDATVVPAIEEEEKTPHEIGLSKVSSLANPIFVGEGELFSRDSKYTELRRKIVYLSDEEPLVDTTDKLDISEKDYDEVAFSSLYANQYSREIIFEGQLVEEGKSELENTKIEQILDSGDQMFKMGVEIGLSHLAEKVQNEHFQSINPRVNEHFEEYQSIEGSVDAHMNNHLASSLESHKHENFEDYESAQGSVDFQTGDQLEPSLASWKQYDGLDDRLSPSHEFQDETFEDYKFGEGSSEAQLRDYLESSLRSWKPLSSDHDEDDESNSGSDGAESSSPDASMADIIPMLDELHPLLIDEVPQACNLSRHSSTAAIEKSVKSPESSIRSEDESDHKEEEVTDGKSDVDDDNEEETRGRKDDSAKSAIMWTDDDQKNLMDLGTSELERNQRLESLIARRRARKMMADHNLIDLDGMDLPFPVAPISTRKNNPFDFPHESYNDLGLPPIPGSAPSIMLNRRNPFDLPYDSSEEKPDLTGDSFQQEFMEITGREAFIQREAMFRRKETFSMGSSAFDFGRPSRFRPYFVPERTDSDGMSYSSLQRQFSELSEANASSAAETESTSVVADQEEKKLMDHDFTQETEPSFEIDQASVLVQHGSQSSENLDSLSCEEKEPKDFVLNMHEVKLGGASSVAAAHTSEAGRSADNRLSYKEISRATESWLSRSDVNHSTIQLMTESIDVNHNTTSSSLSMHKAINDVKMEDVGSCLVTKEHNQVNKVLNVDIPVKFLLDPAVSDVTTEQVLETSDVSRAIQVENNHPKEPIYDSSPLKNNHSLSSSSSDLQRHTSGIDWYHLSRDLFVVEESNIHNAEARNISWSTKQDAADNSLTVNDVGEGSALERAELFSDIDQCPDNSQALVVSEDAGHFNIDSSDKDFKDELLDNNVSSNGVVQIFVQRDDAETVVDGKLDANRSVDNMPFSDGCHFVEDLSLVQEKTEMAVLANVPVYSMFCSEFESKEEIGMEMGVNQQQLQVSSSTLMSHESNKSELLCSLDESHLFLHHSDMHYPWADPTKQEPSSINQKIEEVCQLNKVDEPVNFLVSQNLEHDKSFAIPSNNSFQHEENSIAELAIKEHEQDTPETGHAHIVDKNHAISEGFVADEQNVYEENTDVKEMDEALLSELDAVGDFRVMGTIPNMKNSMAYSTAAVDSNIPARALDEVHLETDMTCDHETSIGDTTVVEKSESDTEIYGTTLVETKEPNDLLALEVPSADNVDAAFMKVSEEFQKSVVAECAQAEFTAKQEVVFPERIQCEHSLLEGHDLDSDRKETDTRMPLLIAKIMEQSGENAEKVNEAVDTSVVEALKAAAETGVGSMQFDLSILERDIKKIDATPLIEASNRLAPGPRYQTEGVSSMEFGLFQEDIDVDQIPAVEASTAPAPKCRDQAEFIGSVELESSQINGNGKETGKIPVVEASAALVPLPKDQTEDIGSMEFESSQLDGNTKDIDKTPLAEASTARAPQSRDQTEGIGSMEFDSLQIREDNKEIGKTPLIEASTAAAPESRDQMDGVIFIKNESLDINEDNNEMGETPPGEASVAAASEPINQTEGVGFMEFESSQMDGDTREIDNTSLVEASTTPTLDPKDQVEGVCSVEIESLKVDKVINEIQEPLVFEASNSFAVESENGNETLDMPVLGARTAPVVESENQREGSTSESLQSDKESNEIHKFPLDGTSIESALMSDLLQTDNEVTATSEFPAHESDNQKGIAGSSEPLQLDTNIPKVQESLDVEAVTPTAFEPDEENDFVGYPESQKLQEDKGIEELQDWHVVEGRIHHVIGSGGRTERTSLTESEAFLTHTVIKAIQNSRASQASITTVPISEDQTLIANHEESGQLRIDRSLGGLKEMPTVEVRDALAAESEGQLEMGGSVESQLFQVDGDSKEIQDCPVLETR